MKKKIVKIHEVPDIAKLFRENLSTPTHTDTDNLEAVAEETSSQSSSNSINNSSQYSWKRFTFVCSKSLAGKLHAIADTEGFSLRQVMELYLQRGVDTYEQKHGTVKYAEKDINSLL